MNSRRYLITGSTGFLGHSMAECLRMKGNYVHGISIEDCSSQDFSAQVREMTSAAIASKIDECKPDVIIHAAGSSSVKHSIDAPVQDFENSVGLLLQLLEGIRLSKHRPLLIYPSSAAVYGNPLRLPVNERDDLSPISPYGYHKVLCEKLTEEYARIFSVPTLIMRLFSVFGMRQRRLLIWELFDRFSNEQKVVLEGTGQETRDYLSVEKVTNLMELAACRTSIDFSILNVASGTSISVRDMAQKVKNIMKSEKEITFRNETRDGDPTAWKADITSLARLVGTDQTEFDLDDSLNTCIKSWLAEVR